MATQTETTEKVIEGRNVDRVKFIGTFDYKSTKEGFAGKKFNRYSAMGITFRAHTERDIDFINDLKAKNVGAIYLVPQKDVVIGKNDDGTDLTKDLWDFDGYSTIKSAREHAQNAFIINAYESRDVEALNFISANDLEKIVE